MRNLMEWLNLLMQFVNENQSVCDQHIHEFLLAYRSTILERWMAAIF